MADYLVPKSVWIVGGDGWAYDIGYGGLDHVLASGRKVNVLVLDTGVYSNTGGQSSKATPRGAVAKFAAAGKGMPKKDLGAIAMSYGNIYVAQVAYGANMTQMVKAFQEAEAYNGPSLIIAYSHCIAHGIDMTTATDLHEDAEKSGFWPLFRFNPMLGDEGKNPLQLDSKPPTGDIKDFAYKQNRFRSLRQADPDRAEMLLEALREDVAARAGSFTSRWPIWISRIRNANERENRGTASPCPVAFNLIRLRRSWRAGATMHLQHARRGCPQADRYDHCCNQNPQGTCA